MSANILVVDDSGTMRTMIRRTIEMCGLDIAEIYEASNGIEALARLHQHAVDVILLDINMPVMDGQKLLQRIRDDPRLRNTPIIIASTEGSETRINDLLASGARGFLRKPFRPESLRDALVPLLGAAHPAAPMAPTPDPNAF